MTVTAFLCGIAPSVGWLVLFRVVAGVGAAMIASATRVLAMEALPETAAGRANAFMTMSFHGGLLLGPPIGGFVIDALSWRWVFFVLIPVGLAGSVLTALRARERRGPAVGRQSAVDYAGAVLLVVLTLVLALLLDRRSADLIGVPRTGVMTTVFTLALAGFVVHERRARTPIVNFALFRIRMFSFSILSLTAIATSTSALMLLLPFYLQDVLHLSPSFMGLLFLAAPVFTISLAPLTGVITDRVGPRVPASIGVLMTMTAFAVAMGLGIGSHWAIAAALLALTGIGQGFFNTANQTAVIASVPREYRGFATGMVQMSFGLGALLGTSLGSALLSAMFRYASGVPDATPSGADPASFVFAAKATYAVCLGLTAVAFAASLMRGGARVGARA
jgi:MFS family permease